MNEAQASSSTPTSPLRRRWLAPLLLAPLLVLSACGGSADEDPVATLRFVNATQDIDRIDIYIDGFYEIAALPARLGQTGYGNVFASGTQVDVTRSGSLTSVGRFAISLGADSLNTGVLIGNTVEGLVYRALNENEPAGDGASTRLRLLNALPGTAAHQLYLTGDSDPLVPGQELFTSARFDDLQAFRSVPAGRYRVRVIRDGDPAAVVFDFTGLTLNGGQSGTFILAPTPGSDRLSLGLFMQGTSGLVMPNQAP